MKIIAVMNQKGGVGNDNDIGSDRLYSGRRNEK